MYASVVGDVGRLLGDRVTDVLQHRADVGVGEVATEVPLAPPR